MTSANGTDYDRFIFKSAESLTSKHHMFSWPKIKRRVRCESESWACALCAHSQSAFLDLSGPRITREEELEFLLAEVRKEVREKRNMIDTYQDLQYTLAEELGQKSRYLQRLQKQNARLQQENAALHVLHLETKLAAAAPKTMTVNDIHDEKLHLPLPGFEEGGEGPTGEISLLGAPAEL